MCIILYLLARDGWLILLAARLSPLTPLITAPSQWYLPVPLPPTHTLSPQVQSSIDEYLARHFRGPVLLRDFALSTDGAIISRELTSSHRDTDPSVVLSDDNRIGNCWYIPSSHGQVGIALPTFIRPTNVSIDHIPVEVAAEPGQAPRRMILWGVVDGEQNTALYHQFSEELQANVSVRRMAPPLVFEGEAELFVVLSEFEYNISRLALVQTFPVRPVVQQLDFDFGQVVLEISENWGAEGTCLYRVRIHGERA
ncbi:hypothetical protein L226DRAFT_474391 [Lentinus tigrinus ALCF2SS1-7]|uniref:SUN domain-containing protein n=1 Tax=Lentinus tigrinus ALCF2SS1-6 TaxID=1328759 RepID=A0A5C2S2V3_9APHY|nr:hypothetical protein L227DRAFT_506105 [Lentinus tigrinus ALCF2SS1-6]RPD67792.1 hypothetical protein L226DRAFT_474391 [Lentinus tigrinus ALCF2SS1-7]